MTARKHLKQLIRARMQKTGESYTTARRQFIRDNDASETDPSVRWHFPGNVPGSTALRVLLSRAGVRAPHTATPFSEAMLFGVAGGIGLGVFSFRYEREDFSSFFLAGRHKWWDDLEYLSCAAAAFGITPLVLETSSSKQAALQLEKLLAEQGTCVAWVDLAHLPHRAVPQTFSGGGYHIITVYRLDPTRGIALIGDLTDEPIAVSLTDLAVARERIKKQKNRLFALPAGGVIPELPVLVRQGLERCLRELDEPSLKPARGNLRLDALQTWAQRLHGKDDPQSWNRVFRRGGPLWVGLISVYQYIEHYGTGGGLCRPLFADFLREAAGVEPRLGELADRYAELGKQWASLAEAALPENVPAFKMARELITERSELVAAGEAPEKIRAVWAQLGELEQAARAQFPLSDVECESLKLELKAGVLALHAGETAALEQLRTVVHRMR